MGGMAVVYLVEHQTLLKRFAAKVLSPEHASNEEARARFTQEAHAASQLDHENIVTISDFGITTDGRPFYVMELLRGRTLMARIEEGPMTIEEVVAVSVPIARALAHAHAEGVIHRDVKPENVFLVQRSQGRWGVKVLDFGIAKVTTNPALTKMGQALGSPMFMAPEACRGDDVDQRADLYSFGVLLYLMLTGRVPFQDDSLLKILQMQVSSPVPLPTKINPSLSPELEAVVLRSLEKKPDDRYPSMDALLAELEAVLPEGSDSILIQAQFGTAASITPFPSQSLRMSAQRSSQRHMIDDKDASSQLEPGTTSKRYPVATPDRQKSSAFIAIGVVVALAAAGVGYWQYTKGSANGGGSVAAADPAITPAPAGGQVPAPIEPTEPSDPLPPRHVGPAEPVDVPVVAAVEPPMDAPPDAAKKTPAVKAPKKVPEPPAPKRVAVAPTKVETPAPKTGSAGSAAKVVTAPETKPVIPPETKPAIVATPVVTPKETIKVEPPVTPPPVKPPPPKPVVVDAGSMDAAPTIASLDVNGPLPSSVVRRGVERILPALRACYRTAAQAKRQTLPVTLTLRFEVDESSVAARVSASGAKEYGTLAGCAKSAVSKLTTQQAPDVGTVSVALSISFRPS